MPSVTLVRYTTKSDRTEENETLSRGVFAELRNKAPGHMTYALFRNGDDFVHLFVNTRDNDSSALTELPSFKAFSRDSTDRYAAPPEVIRLDLSLVESYGLVRALSPA